MTETNRAFSPTLALECGDVIDPNHFPKSSKIKLTYFSYSRCCRQELDNYTALLTTITVICI